MNISRIAFGTGRTTNSRPQVIKENPTRLTEKEIKKFRENYKKEESKKNEIIESGTENNEIGIPQQPLSEKNKPIVNAIPPSSYLNFPPLDEETLGKYEKYFKKQREGFDEK